MTLSGVVCACLFVLMFAVCVNMFGVWWCLLVFVLVRVVW